jgi:hypothetical protein
MPSWPIELIRWIRTLIDETGLLLINLVGIVHIVKFLLHQKRRRGRKA